MNAKNFRAVILFMANQWNKDVAIKIWGESLGLHFFSKWNARGTSADEGTMRLFYEMTTDNLQKLLDYVEKENKLEKSYTYKEMENAVHLSGDLTERVCELADDGKNGLVDMRHRAEFFIDAAVKFDKRLGGKNEEEGNYDYVEELDKFESEIMAELNS